jgi:hypothetical protein
MSDSKQLENPGVNNRVSLTLKREFFSVESLSGKYKTQTASTVEFRSDGNAVKGFFEVNVGTKWHYTLNFGVDKGNRLVLDAPKVNGELVPLVRYRGDIIDYISPLVKSVADENNLAFTPPNWMVKPYAGYYETAGQNGRDHITDLAQITELLRANLKLTNKDFTKPSDIHPRVDSFDTLFTPSYGPH